MRWLQAKSLLAWQLILHLFKRLFYVLGLRKNRGLAQFNENYGQEGLRYLNYKQRQTLPHFQSCLNCLLCDADCPALNRMPGPSHIVMAVSRDMSITLNNDDVELCGECTRCEDLCPSHVPIKAIIKSLA